MTLDHLREIALIQISQAQRTNAMTVNPMTRLPETKLAAFRAAERSPETDRAHGAVVLQLINKQNLASLHTATAKSWKARTDAQVRAAYEAAMRGEDAPLVANISLDRAGRMYL